MEMLEKEGLQSTQALYHNLNTLESRAGSQVPFTSINFGLDTTFEGRKVTEWLLKASLDGIGKHHTTSIFPISIFQYKKGINDREYTPNYDLKLLAIKSLSRKIYPNICNTDWISNHADKHPSEYIMEDIKESEDGFISIREEDNYTDKENKKVEEYVISLKEFVYKLRDRYWKDKPCKIDVKQNECVLFDFRNLKDRFLIKDTTQKYNKYATKESDAYTRLSVIRETTDDDLTRFYAITTESFGYDVMRKEVIDNVEEIHVVHVQYPIPKYNPDTEMATMGKRKLQLI